MSKFLSLLDDVVGDAESGLACIKEILPLLSPAHLAQLVALIVAIDPAAAAAATSAAVTVAAVVNVANAAENLTAPALPGSTSAATSTSLGSTSGALPK